jgi:hypothetical protein
VRVSNCIAAKADDGGDKDKVVAASDSDKQIAALYLADMKKKRQ